MDLKSLYVAGIPRTLQGHEIERFFSKHEKIEKCYVPWNKHDHTNKGFCFISFDNPRSPVEVLFYLQDTYYGQSNQKLKISYKEERKKIDSLSADYQKGYNDCLQEIHDMTGMKLKRKLDSVLRRMPSTMTRSMRRNMSLSRHVLIA